MTLELLLQIQQHDTEIDRSEYLRKTLPELEELEVNKKHHEELAAKRAELLSARGAVSDEQKRLEAEVKSVSDRRKSENERLYSGTVTAHKDLVAIQEELDMLAERQDSIEELVLEQMLLAEPIDVEIAEVDAAVEKLDIAKEEILTRVAERNSEIDDEIALEAQKKAEIVGQVSDELLEIYEKTRKERGGLAVVELKQKRCMGCRLELPAVQYESVRAEPADAVIYHDCGRILVRKS